MVNKKISDLTALNTPASGDLMEIVDISDLTDAATGTNKKITLSDLQTGFTFLPLAGGQMTGDIDVNLNEINNIADMDQGNTEALGSFFRIGNSDATVSAVQNSGIKLGADVVGRDVIISPYRGAVSTDMGLHIQTYDNGVVDAFRLLETGEAIFYKTAEFNEVFDNGNSGVADTIDFGVSNIQESTLTGNVTYTFTAPNKPSRVNLIIKSGAGGFSVTFPTINWVGGTVPTLTSTASAVDIITLIWDGTVWYGTASLDFK